jgi:hypothetical protein
MELSKYGRGGRRSFVIVLKGDKRKGWREHCMQILCLKQYYEKQCAGEIIKGPHMEKVLVAKPPRKITKRPKGVHNKGSYVEMVGNQYNGNHNAKEGATELI